MSAGLGYKTASLDVTDPATPDEFIQTTVERLGVDYAAYSLDGVMQKNVGADVFSAVKAKCLRQTLGICALEQMERIFTMVENVVHRHVPQKIIDRLGVIWEEVRQGC
jgi:hypothetical protein